ncbi:hypothetical protein Tco_0729731 [Tanacetum coccineum]|uniref:Uncharacterized protein n=1 Tax=Tanacetum coccineum TaxID=301880 RepID=A0ABQ4YQN3_9ASTR
MATSSSFIGSKLKSPTSSTSPSTNGYLTSTMSPPPRVTPPPPTQERGSMDITLTLSPITPLDIQFNTPSPSIPSPPLFGHPISWNLFETHRATCFTSKEIDYDSPEYKGPPKSLLKWYGYLSDDSDAKPSFSNILKAKACILAKAQASEASSKALVQACGSKAKLQTSRSKAKLQTSPKTFIYKSSVPITNCILGIAKATTCDAILSKTFGLKIPLTMACADEKKGKMKIGRGS